MAKKKSDRSKKDKKKKKKKDDAPIRLRATNADRHLLYQASVQNPDFEVEVASDVFERLSGRKALTLREDFCGTAIISSRWVASDEERTALCIDINEEVLKWGEENNVAELAEDAERIELVLGDVRDPHPARHDVVMAFNYSYSCFKDRDTLRGYFEAVRENLNDDGIFMMDIFGGWESVQTLKEERKVKNFWYIWEQASYNPITADFLAHIHFRFRDGSKMKKAFTYDWRLWTIPELRELLIEAGYEHVEVLWEDEDEEGDGTGEFRPQTVVENDPGFNSYLVAKARA